MRNLISINKKCELSQKEESKELQIKKEAELKKMEDQINKKKIIQIVNEKFSKR